MNKITIKKDGSDYEIDYSDLQFTDDINAINRGLMNHVAKYTEIAMLHIGLKMDRKIKEGELSATRAMLDGELRNADAKKPTEKAIEMQIDAHPKILSLQQQIFVLERDEMALYVLKEAYEDHKDCLMEVARNLRAQMNSVGSNSV